MTRQYENHLPPEGINSSDEHPLKQLLILLGGIIAIVIIILALLNLFIGAIADKIPYHYEDSIASIIVTQFAADEQSKSAHELQTQNYLQQLADDLAVDMALPETVKLTVHYSDEDTVNAFATLGGHIFMYRGLIEKLPNENALSMVLGHEIAHIKHRHPIIAMGQGLTLAIALAAIGGISDNRVADTIAKVANINSMQFSRAHETESDLTSLHAVAKRYQHVQGAAELFSVFFAIEAEQFGKPNELFSTHPLSQKRIANIALWAEQNNYPLTGDTTPLPSFIVNH